MERRGGGAGEIDNEYGPLLFRNVCRPKRPVAAISEGTAASTATPRHATPRRAAFLINVDKVHRGERGSGVELFKSHGRPYAY